MSALAKAPEKDAVYHLISKSYTLNADGSTEFRKRTELQIFTRMTFDHFGETFITYNPDFQELIINEAYTLRKDGSKVETPANAFNPMLPESCTKCERLNGIRTMVVTHTALEYDATIVLDYTIRSKNFFFQELMEQVDLQEEVPVEKYVVSVTTPDYKPAKFQLNGENLHYTKTESTSKDNMVTTSWTFTNLPEIPTDEYLFPSAVATLTFFTFDKEEEIISRITNQNSTQKFDNQKITEFFRSRFTEEMTDMDKVLFVRDYIHDYIRTNNLDAKTLNYMFASPQQVWESNCATPIEKDILLAGVLKSLGYDAQLGFLNNTLANDLETVVKVVTKGHYISANEKVDLSLEAFFAPATLIMQNSKIEKVEIQPISVEMITDIFFEAGKLDNPTVTMQHTSVESPLCHIMEVRGYKSPAVSESQINNKYHELTIDDSYYGTQVRSVNIHNDRTYAINTGQSDEKYSYSITLPSNVRCLTKPVHKEITIENAKMLIDVQVDGQTVKITRQLSLPQEGISAKNVKKFKAMMGEWEAPVKVVFVPL